MKIPAIIQDKQINIVPFAVSLLVLLIILIITGNSVDGGHVALWEANLFRFINGLPEAFYYPMTLFQYSGTLGTPAFFAVIALYFKKFYLAFLLLIIMPAKLLLEDVIKANFQRERPKVYIPDAILRGDVQASGLSFVSGHAVIIFAIATLLTPFVPNFIKIGLWALAVLCIVARVYLGAHLPLDVFGGAITGAMVGLALLFVHSLTKKLLTKTKADTDNEITTE